MASSPQPTSLEIPTEPPSPERRGTQVGPFAQKLVWIEHVQGNKFFPMQDVEKKVIDELCTLERCIGS